MKKKFLKLIVLLFVFLVQNSFGQEKLNSDYIIKKEGDTIYGIVDYKKNNLIKFRELQNERIGDFAPQDIKAFKVNGVFYLSATIKTDKDIVETVFLQNLIEGDKSLYSYESSGNITNYYIKQEEKYLILQNHNSKNKGNNAFKGKLVYYLSDCPSITSVVENSSYNDLSLLKVFEKYYSCTDSNPTYKSEKKIHIDKGLFIGASLTSLKFEDTKGVPYLKSEYELSTNITLGMFLELFINKKKGWSLYNEIQYYSYKTSNHTNDIENENVFTINDTEISHSFVKLNNLIRYNTSVVDQSMFFNIGVTNGYVIKEKNFRRKETNIYSTYIESTHLAIPKTKKNEFGIILGAGTKFERLSFEARFESTSGVVEKGPNSRLNKFYLLVGYSL